MPSTAARTPAPTQRRPKAPKKSVPNPWQRQLHSLLHPPATSRHTAFNSGVVSAAAAPTLQLGVQLDLQETAPGRTWSQQGLNDPWQSQAASAISLTARPVKLGVKGNWVAAQLRWDTFGRFYYGYQREEFRPEQVRWMRTFAAIYAIYGSQATSTHLPLDQFHSPLLWQLLAEARDIGVALVAAKSGDAVVIHDPVSISMDLRTHDGGLRLAPHVALSGDTSSPDHRAIGMIGQPGHGVFWWDPSTSPGTTTAPRGFHLAPSASAVPEALRPLIRHRMELLVPASARSSFLGATFPQLSQATDVVSSDSSVDLPQILPPELVLTAIHDSPTLQLHWHWEYPSAGTITRQPVPDAGNGYRDHPFEAQLLARRDVRLRPVSRRRAGSVRGLSPHCPRHALRAGRYSGVIAGADSPVATLFPVSAATRVRRPLISSQKMSATSPTKTYSAKLTGKSGASTVTKPSAR